MGKRTREELFLSKVGLPDENGCMRWRTGARKNVYRTFWLGDHATGSHRFAYEHWVGPIPNGMQIDHLCKVRDCVAPDHLEVVTAKENIRRSTVGDRERARTHCPKGHPYDEANTYVRPCGKRKCRACNREREAMKRKADL